MSKQNLRRNCTVLLSALFSSTFITNARDNSIIDQKANNEKIEDIIVDAGNNNIEETTKDDSNSSNPLIEDSNNNISSENVNDKKDESVSTSLNVNSNLEQTKKSSGLSTPAKFAIGLGTTTLLGAGAKLWWDNHSYNSALKEANKYADEVYAKSSKNQTVNNEPLAAWVNHIGNSKLSKKLKTKLLILFKNDGCSDLANWLCSRLEHIKKDMKLEFLTDDEFIKSCKNFKYDDDNIKDKRNFLILKFIGSYLNYNKKSLLANPPKSFDQIPNWNIIKTVIGADFTPFEEPEKIENNAIRFKIQNKIGKVYTITIK